MKGEEELVPQIVRQSNGIAFSSVSQNTLPWSGTQEGSRTPTALTFEGILGMDLEEG